jgi:hypothetical protein
MARPHFPLLFSGALSSLWEDVQLPQQLQQLPQHLMLHHQEMTIHPLQLKRTLELLELLLTFRRKNLLRRKWKCLQMRTLPA